MNPSTPIAHGASVVRLRFSMELLTDALPGAGSAPGETFDNTVRTDRFGLPYLPARTLKGLWLNAFREYADVMGEEALSQADLALLFGTPGTEGCLRFGNGQPEGAENFEAWLTKVPPTHRPDPTRVKEAFVTRRGQTRIDPVTGTAVRGTLRQAQYLRAGLEFTAEITLQPPPDPQELERLHALLRPDEAGRTLLQAVVKSDALRRFGTNRNRGVGAVACRLEPVRPGSVDTSGIMGLVRKTQPESALFPSTQTQPDGRRLRRILRLTNPERLSIADNQPNGVDCLSYLPGSLLLGAMAGAFRRAVPKSPEADTRFRTLFLDGTCRFANAHLCDSDGNRSLPAPIGFFRTKDRRLDEQGRLVLSMERSADFCKALGGFAVPIPGQDTLLREVRPLLIDALHVALPGNRGYGGKADSNAQSGAGAASGPTSDPSLYSMQALEAGQTFASVVEGPADCLSQLEALFPNGSTLQVGRSRGAQYGSVRVEWGQSESLAKSKPTAFCIDNPPMKKVYALMASPFLPSPFLASDDTFLAKPPLGVLKDPIHALEEGSEDQATIRFALARALSLPATMVQVEAASVIRQTMTGGFNAYWGVPRPHLAGLAAGSTLILSLPASHADTIRTIWLGQQTQEGYGEVVLFPKAFQRLVPSHADTQSGNGSAKMHDSIVAAVPEGKRDRRDAFPWTLLQHQPSQEPALSAKQDAYGEGSPTPLRRVTLAFLEDALRQDAIEAGRRHALDCRIPHSTTASRMRGFLSTCLQQGKKDLTVRFWAEVLQMKKNQGREFYFWFNKKRDSEEAGSIAEPSEHSLFEQTFQKVLAHLDHNGFQAIPDGGRSAQLPLPQAAVDFQTLVREHCFRLYLDTFLHNVYRNAVRGDL